MPKPPKDPKAKAAYDAYVAQIGVEQFPHLEGMELDFREADFSGFNLDGANLRGANLEHVEFERTILWNVAFSGANLDYASFMLSDLHDAELWETRVHNANFRNIRSGEMEAIQADFQGSDFTNADLMGAAFLACDLRDVKFRDVKLSTGFHESRLFGADFTGATGSVRRGLVDVGEHEPQWLNQSQFIEWLHDQGAIKVTKYVPPNMKPEDLDEWLSLEE